MTDLQSVKETVLRKWGFCPQKGKTTLNFNYRFSICFMGQEEFLLLLFCFECYYYPWRYSKDMQMWCLGT